MFRELKNQMVFKIVSFTILFLCTAAALKSQINRGVDYTQSNNKDNRHLVLSNNDNKIAKNILLDRKWSVDIFFYPQFKFKNAVLTKMYLIQANINPTLHFHMWKGANLTAQLILPIFNEFSLDESKVRPGFITLSQQFHTPGNFLFLATVGNFNMQRAGVDLKAFKNISSSIGVYGQIGLTGWSVPYLDKWYFSDMNKTNWRVGANYFLKSKNVLFNVNLSKYLENDIAVRGEIIRYFGNASIGFFVQSLNYDEYAFNGGFFFTITLPPRNKGNKRHRISTSEHFALEYIARPYPQRGVLYKTAPNENSNFNFFNNSLLNLN